jgi:hypothetical protein
MKLWPWCGGGVWAKTTSFIQMWEYDLRAALILES